MRGRTVALPSLPPAHPQRRLGLGPLFSLILGSWWFGCATSSTGVEPTEAGTLTAGPTEVRDVKVAPDGVHFFLWARSPTGEDALVVKRVRDRVVVGGFRFPPETKVYRVEWANEQRLVMEVGQDAIEVDGPAFYGDIYAIDLDRSNPRLIFGFRAGKAFTTGTSIVPTEPIEAWGSILGPIPDSDDEILIASQRWPTTGVSSLASENEPGMFEVYAVSTSTGKRRRVVSGPGAVIRYLVDERGEVRVAHTLSAEQREQVHVRDPGGPWRLLPEFPGRPVGVSHQHGVAYVIGDEASGPGLHAVQLGGGERRLLHRRPDAEPSDFAWDPVTGAPVAAEYEPALPLWALLDPASAGAKILAQAGALRPGFHPRFVNLSRDGRLASVHFSSDTSPGFFMLIEADPPWAVQVARVLDPFEPAPHRTGPVEVKVSDGLVVRGYLTVPDRAKAPVPLVVVPHGGPHGVRDHWAYDPFVQTLADQGLAVLRVNFRGSAGYGRAFEEAGRRHWGDRVQDDVIEVTRAVLQQNPGFDRKRIGIVGHSFGGYSALQSVRRAPDLFRCAIGISGVYELQLLRQEGDVVLTRRGRRFLDRSLGLDPAGLTQASPSAHPEEIPVPVLLVHGDRDRRAPVEHATRLCEAMTRAGRRCDLWVAEGQGHTLTGVALVESHLRVSTFLANQLGLSL